MNHNPSIFEPLPSPYYIWVRDFMQASGGIRAMHYLCHALNLSGQEAYILASKKLNPHLRTPMLTPALMEQHKAGGRLPIAVYPEVVSGNPLPARNVARWLLADPGVHTGKQIELGQDDLVFTFGPTIVPPGWSADPLRVPLVDTRIFHSSGVVPGSRSGSAVFINRHLQRGGKLEPVIAESIEISGRVPERSPEQLAQLLRSVECLYLYEFSTIVFEALLCGCPVIFVPNEVYQSEKDRIIWNGTGIAWSLDPVDIARAKATVHEAVEVYREEERSFWEQLRIFVDKTQARARMPD